MSEAKAMDDTVNRLESMFSGGGESPAAAPRRGTSPQSKTINWGTPKQDSSMVSVTYRFDVRSTRTLLQYFQGQQY